MKMNAKNLKKLAAYLMIIILAANIILLALGRISQMLFWIIIIIFAIVAYSGVFKSKKKVP